jgi:S1-C subfamily serine protease
MSGEGLHRMIRKIAVALLIGTVPIPALAGHLEDWPQSGSGFFITSDGYFVTSFHVIEHGAQITLTLPNRAVVPAAVVATDAANDLALLKAEGQFRALPVADSRKARRGWSVMTVGYPHINIQGLEPKVTRGIINSLSGIADNPNVFQVDLPIQRGNSGGPLVTEEGVIVGVITSRLNSSMLMTQLGTIPQNVNYAVKSDYLLELVERLPHVKAKVASRPKRQFSSFPLLTEYVEEATAIVQAAPAGEQVTALPRNPVELPAANHPE